MPSFISLEQKILIAALGSALSSAAWAAPVTPEMEMSFTRFALERISARFKDRQVVIKGPLTLEAGTWTLNLGRVFEYCRNNALSCPEALDDYAGGMADALSLPDRAVSRESVRLVVRTDEYVRQGRAATAGKSAPLVVRPLAPGLWAAAVMDTPRSLRVLNHDDLKKLKLSEDEVFALGGSNVRAELGPLSQHAPAVGAGTIGRLNQGPGAYESGRVASHADWAALAQAQNGVLLVAVPASDVVLYASEATPQAVAAFRAAAIDTARKNPVPVSTLILKWTPEGWETIE